MKCDFLPTPRKFNPIESITLKDMGSIQLDLDEQLTFVTENGQKNDIVRKSWGYYLTNSLNHTLKRQGFKTALVGSSFGGRKSLFVKLVEEKKQNEFLSYLAANSSELICWLDEWFDKD